jgi:protein phosphatase/serine/threonine-protein phosphatase Stp1
MTQSDPMARSVLSAGRFHSSAASHPGAVRDHNEDRFVNRPDLGLWAVADGAGGHQAGEVAASLVADTLRAVPAGLGSAALLAEVRLRIERAHKRLQEEAARRGGDILATTVVVLLARAGHYACLWAGDSRAYLLRGGVLIQVSRDHSFVQELLDAGEITPAEAAVHPRANIITRAVGARDAIVNLDKVTDRLRSGDRFLLCSDGVSKTLAEGAIARLLAEGDDAPAPRLIAAALHGQADDNVTAVVVEWRPEPAASVDDSDLTRRW